MNEKTNVDYATSVLSYRVDTLLAKEAILFQDPPQTKFRPQLFSGLIQIEYGFQCYLVVTCTEQPGPCSISTYGRHEKKTTFALGRTDKYDKGQINSYRSLGTLRLRCRMTHNHLLPCLQN